MALTKDDIWLVADRLDAQGKAPTLAAVRKALGSGSFTTISEAMREWHQRRKEQSAKAQEAGPVPQDLDDAISRFAREVWAKAAEIAKAEKEKLAAEYAASQKEWERERQELVAAAEDLSAALEESRGRESEARAALEDLARRHAEKEAEINALKERLRETEARLEELRAEQLRLIEVLRQKLQNGGDKQATD